MTDRPITQAVIMAAGRGTRMRPLTDRLPKPMLPLAGRPILEWTLSQLPESVAEAILVVGYRQEAIRRHFGATWRGRRISYVEQTELKGTGQAIHCCRPLLAGRFLAMNGDDLYCRRDIERLVGTADQSAILVRRLERTGRFGAVRLDSNGRFVGLESATPADRPGLVNTGLYLLTDDFFEYPLVPLKSAPEFGLPQTLAGLAAERPVAAVEASFWFPIGCPEDLAPAEQALAALKLSQ